MRRGDQPETAGGAALGEVLRHLPGRNRTPDRDRRLRRGLPGSRSMKLAELRKLTIKKQIRIRFVLPNGLECIVNEHGIAQIPALKAVPDFNLERELPQVGQFVLEPTITGKKAA